MNDALLKKRMAETPQMEPVDAVKLVFQSELGCGHLLGSPEECEASVRDELAVTPERAAIPPATPLGGGLCRLNLAAPAVRALSPRHIARMMALTNDRVLARQPRLDAALQSLERLARVGETPFSAAALNAYLAGYRARGCPPVSHSARYRAAYAPAYRVVLADFAALLPVIAWADAALSARGHAMLAPSASVVEEHVAEAHANPPNPPLLPPNRAVIVLDGNCGAGKTTLAGLLGELYGTSPLPMDDFFLPPALRTPQRLAQPGGNVDYERFAAEALSGLLSGGAFAYRRFDCATGGYAPRAREPSAVTVIEGSYSHHPFFDAAYARLGALRVFVAVEAGEQLRRLGLRCPSLLPRFQSEWIPLEKTFFEAYDIRKRADLVVESLPWEA